MREYAYAKYLLFYFSVDQVYFYLECFSNLQLISFPSIISVEQMLLLADIRAAAKGTGECKYIILICRATVYYLFLLFLSSRRAFYFNVLIYLLSHNSLWYACHDAKNAWFVFP